MKTTIELTAYDIRRAIKEYLAKRGYPADVLDKFGEHDYKVMTTYRSNEKYRKPTYLKFVVTKET